MIDSLARQLFVGTQRETVPIEGVCGRMAEIVERLGRMDATPEERILHLCSLGGAFEAAGWLPQADTPVTIAPSVEDDRKTCSERAAAILREALARPWPTLAAEWMERASEKGFKPPCRSIPALLDLATRLPSYRELIAERIGPRGLWMSQFSPAWRWMSADETEESVELEAWETGSPAERRDFLTGLRRKAPEKARELVKDGLKTDTAGVRAKLIGAFDEGLSIEDEETLENMLDDRSVEVRRIVALLLSRIPDSQLSQRMGQRLADCLSMKKSLLNWKCDIEPPEKADKAMKRDGILDKPVAGLGARAAILMRIVSFTPLARWKDACGCDPENILSAVRKTDWGQAMFMGFFEAAVNQKDPAWLMALLKAKKPSKVHLSQDELIRALPPADLEAWAISSLAPQDTSGLRNLIDSSNQENRRYWGEKLSRKALETVKDAVERLSSDWYLKDCINDMALLIHPGLLEEALQGWPENRSNWEYYADKASAFFEIVGLRKELYKELICKEPK